MNKDSFIEALTKCNTKFHIHSSIGEITAFRRKMPTLETILQVEDTIDHLGCYSYWFFDRERKLLGVAHYEAQE